MGDMNRDWERIVRYESQNNFQNGYLNGEFKFNPTPEEIIYMQAISQADACRFCKAILNGRKYILTNDVNKIGAVPPKEYDFVDGYLVKGSTNIGNNPKNYIPTIPLHPHCRCRWVRYYKEFEELE